MSDARKHVRCAMTALQAAVHHRPDLGPTLGRVHADLADVVLQLDGVRL